MYVIETIGRPSSTSLNRIVHLRSVLLNALSACPKPHYTATDSGQFPCGYRIDVVLVFNNERRLRERYIHRFRICP